MSDVYNSEYYQNHCGFVPYDDASVWMEHFGRAADHIIADFHPQTVLDAGCAMGWLVAALRDRGVEAYGIDISEYAISKAREDIRPYCRIGSLTDPILAGGGMPSQFDLVTNIEVVEHMYEEDGREAIKNLCSVTQAVLFSSGPDDIEEKTHVNVQQPEYWVKRFAEHGFFKQIGYQAPYISPHAMLLCKKQDVSRVAEDYERECRVLQSEGKRLLEGWNALEEQLRSALSEKERLEAELLGMKTSLSWRMTGPCRSAKALLKRVAGRG